MEQGHNNSSARYFNMEQEQRPPIRDFWKWWLLPHWFKSVSCVLLFYWTAYYSIVTVSTDWVGRFVFGGDPSATEETEFARYWGKGVVTILSEICSQLNCGYDDMCCTCLHNFTSKFN